MAVPFRERTIAPCLGKLTRLLRRRRGVRRACLGRWARRGAEAFAGLTAPRRLGPWRA